MAAYDEIIKAGKVRYIAASNLSPERLIKSFEVAEKNNLPKYVALQPHYNLGEREKFETQYAPLVGKFGLSVFPVLVFSVWFFNREMQNGSRLN